MSDKQYLRNIDAGDVAFEGRQSNGFLAKEDGSTILYGAVKQDQLETLKSDNVNIDGVVSSVIAFMAAEKNLDFPEGNNNNETTNTQTNSNKITTVTLTPTPLPTATPTPTPTPSGITLTPPPTPTATAIPEEKISNTCTN